MSDALLDAILATPDDDAPRLVWADREGGERGELVVVQCALAKTLEPAERERLQARERELLARVPSALGDLRGEFQRGFIEHLAIDFSVLEARLGDIFAAWPTLRSLDIRPLAPSITHDGPDPKGVWESVVPEIRAVLQQLPPGRITRLLTAPSVHVESDWSGPSHVDYNGVSFVELVAEAPALANLTALELWASGLHANAIPHLARLRHLAMLRIDDHFFDGASLAQVLRAVPTLRHLALSQGRPGAGSWLGTLGRAPEFAQLTKLDLLQRDLYREDRAALDALPEHLRCIVTVQ